MPRPDVANNAEALAAAFRIALEPVVTELRTLNQAMRVQSSAIKGGTQGGGGNAGSPGVGPISGRSGSYSQGQSFLSARFQATTASLINGGLSVSNAASVLGGAIGGPIGGAVGGALGSVGDYALRPTKDIIKKTVFGTLTDVGRYGQRTQGAFGQYQQVAGSFAQALGSAPIVGSEVGRVFDPIRAAGSRVLAVTGLIARGGGRVDDNTREQLFRQSLREERSAAEEERAVGKLVSRESSSNRSILEASINYVAATDRLIDFLRILTGLGGSR